MVSLLSSKLRNTIKSRLELSCIQIRRYNFASTEFKSCFGGLPIADGVKLRKDTIAYLDQFDEQMWYDDPATSILNGEQLSDGDISPTVDAFEGTNGNIRLAT